MFFDLYGYHMKREDFVFTIGYQGASAVVDGSSKKRYGKMGVEELLDKGQYKFAVASALFDGDQKAIELIVRRYNEQAGTELQDADQLQKLFGVILPPEQITSTIIVK